jgi:multidrug transporter EmrE-like cation transporter
VSAHLIAAASAAGSRAGPGRVAAGVVVAVCSATLYNVGYVLEKQALNALPPVSARLTSVFRLVRSSRRWMAGFVAMVAALGLQVLALTMAPVSVVQPVLVAGLVALVVLGGPLLGERLGWRQRTALILILTAVAAIAVSAGAGGRVARGVPGLAFAALALPLAAAGIAVSLGSLRTGRGPVRDHDAPGIAGVGGLVGLAVGAGLLYGVGAVAEKAVATTLVGHGLVGGAGTALATPYPWVFVVATAAGLVVFQVALQRHPASLTASLANVASSLCALLGASVVFGELLLPPGWWSLARVAGFAAVVAAAAVLVTGRRTASEAAVT